MAEERLFCIKFRRSVYPSVLSCLDYFIIHERYTQLKSFIKSETNEKSLEIQINKKYILFYLNCFTRFNFPISTVIYHDIDIPSNKTVEYYYTIDIPFSSAKYKSLQPMMPDEVTGFVIFQKKKKIDLFLQLIREKNNCLTYGTYGLFDFGNSFQLSNINYTINKLLTSGNSDIDYEIDEKDKLQIIKENRSIMEFIWKIK